MKSFLKGGFIGLVFGVCMMALFYISSLLFPTSKIANYIEGFTWDFLPFPLPWGIPITAAIVEVALFYFIVGAALLGWWFVWREKNRESQQVNWFLKYYPLIVSLIPVIIILLNMYSQAQTYPKMKIVSRCEEETQLNENDCRNLQDCRPEHNAKKKRYEKCLQDAGFYK